MSRLIVQMQMSIDGFVDSDVPGSRWQLWDWGPNWTWSADARARFNALFASASGILLSRPMAGEGYLTHWRRTAEQHPDEPDYEFAARIGRLPKFVVTEHHVADQPGTKVINGSFAEAVRQAKHAVDGNLICFGGAGFVAALLQHHLVDELQLYVNPGLAGHGARIFGDTLARDRFTLLDATPTACGILITRWNPTRPEHPSDVAAVELPAWEGIE
ncbi:dihydrofolate reductase family protein [Actinacidiphila oryziradicis]|nr:dihydrofolate reductase family protein [Actinacidiphila oryziradicis]